MDPISELLVKEADFRICDESIPRVRRCLAKLDDRQIWARPHSDMASIGNLVLHVCGNARQWILQALDGQPDVRDRDLEFSTPGPLPVSELHGLLDELEADLRESWSRIVNTDLTRKHTVQVFHETGVGILVHAIEHFSYHTGQIARDTKRFLNVDLGFYDHLDL